MGGEVGASFSASTFQKRVMLRIVCSSLPASVCLVFAELVAHSEICFEVPFLNSCTMPSSVNIHCLVKTTNPRKKRLLTHI